jgi:hypothetical protein
MPAPNFLIFRATEQNSVSRRGKMPLAPDIFPALVLFTALESFDVMPMFTIRYIFRSLRIRD